VIHRRKFRWLRCFSIRGILFTGISLTIATALLTILLVLPWRWLPLPTSSFMLQSVFQNKQVYEYRWTPYSQISPEMSLAAIAGEDQRFPTHHGFDWDALQQAVTDYNQGSDLRGASTISQQVAKNLYLWSGRSLFRKALEAWFTVLIEWLWSKQRILEIYLNIAQFSAQIFGVEAASQHFFAHPASQLNREEAALLAAVLPGPELYQVDQPSPPVVDRQYWILRQMDQLGGVNYLDNIR
jgi:monofunctional biosynthetic peptidoglycan transglycosylase